MKRIAYFVLLPLLVVSLIGCQEFMVKKDQTETIDKPFSASVSPKMDFEKITTVAVFPFFPGASADGLSTEDPDAAERIVTSFISELTTRQSQWKILTNKDVLDAIAKNNLGRGYKNFQADINTARGQMSSFVMTEETKNFIKKLSTSLKVNAIIFGNYDVNSAYKMVDTIMGPQRMLWTSATVNVALYYVQNDQTWWKATHKKSGNNKDKIISDISKSLAAYIGKGTLQQL